MTVTITAFAASPDRGRGLARDMRVRWALEAPARYLMMVTALRRLESSGLLADYPSRAANIAHGEARLADQRAFTAQLAIFEV